MKNAQKYLLIVLAAGLLSGCVRYDVTLNNGSRLVNVYKPKLNEETGEYTIRSATGGKTVVRKSRISVIEPHRKSNAKNAADGSGFFLQ